MAVGPRGFRLSVPSRPSGCAGQHALLITTMENIPEIANDNSSKTHIHPSETLNLDAIESHAIRDPESPTALFFIRSDPTGPSREWASRYGYTPVPAVPHSSSKGRVVGGEPGTPLLVVVRATPGALIEMPQTEKVCFPPVRLFLRVTPGSELIPETCLDRPNLVMETTALRFYDDDLLSVFADPNLPPWLRTILDAQLKYWNKHHAETYYRFTPWSVWGEEFVRCIKAAPYWALARWKPKLFPNQIDYCMRRSGAGAVAFCLNRVPRYSRNSILGMYAEDALAYVSHRMTEHEILFCAEKEPFAALRWRRNFSPALRAKVLAQVVPLDEWDPTDLPSGLEEDIMESIASFPQVWLNRYGSFISAMERISKHLAIQPDGPTALALYERIDAVGKEEFLEYIASRI